MQKPTDFILRATALALIVGPAAWTRAQAPHSDATSSRQEKEAVTFSRDVLPILQSRCQECHRPNRIAPMSLLTYAEVRPWASAIRKSVVAREMPPFHADGPLGRFEDDVRLTEEQIATIARWVDSGAPQGNPADAPPPVEPGSDAWMLGEPDLVITFPSYAVQASETDSNVLLYSDYVFPQETWVESIEFKSTDYRIVHHAGVNAVGPDFFVPEDLILNTDDEHLDKFDGRSDGGLKLQGAKNHLYTWLPGQLYEKKAPGDGFRVGAGERLTLRTHIGPAEHAGEFTVSLGLHFVNGYITRDTRGKLGRIEHFEIPAGAPSHEIRTTRTFGRDSRVIAFNVHMHARGKSSQFLFHYPDGRTETAFNLPRYNLDWQRDYYLAEPMEVPAGTVVEFIAEFDNSANNPINPDPTVNVHWGPTNLDEMYDGIVVFSLPLDKPIRVVHGIAQPAGTE